MADPWKRRVEIGDCVLYEGDCLEVMPTLGDVDAVVTDPPYGNQSKWHGGGWAAKSVYLVDGAKWDKSPSLDIVAKLLIKNLPTILWGGNYFELPSSRGWLVWEKDGAGTCFTLGHGELAWTNLDIPIRFFKHPRHKGTGKNKPVHPTQKPLALMKWCLGFLPDAETILDPFMGSGTTLVACAKLGRRGIGIEMDPGYFDIACKRVEEAYRQPDLFVDPPAKPEQMDMLK